MWSSYHRRLLIVVLLLAGAAALLVSNSLLNPTAGAFSAGPPPGYARAPGEEPEACAECHLSSGDPGAGQISITVPPTYVPGQTYQVTVTHTNPDTSRLRWGFQLTALDSSDDKAGELQNTSVLTQVITGGPGGNRQYIEHSSSGTFINQQGGASWTFNWVAPATDVGVVTFYAAGNHANNDGNTSGDYIYFTFASSQPAAATPDFSVSGSPSLQTVAPGNGTTYNITATPANGFTGNVSLSISGLPTDANASFDPTSVNLTDTTAKSSTLSVTTGSNTPVGTFPLTITAISGMLQHTTNVSLRVVSATSADVSITKTASPNPGLSGSTLTYRLVIGNSGPAAATNVNVTDNLPGGVTFGSATTTQGSCSGTGPVNCSIGTLASGASAIVTITVTPTASGQITNNATVTATEADPDSSNNTAALITVIDTPPPAPILLDQNLTVSPVVTGLDQPTTMAFLKANEFFVLERATGRVQRVLNGQLQAPALDLAVNNNSERGLLGIALHPNFAFNGYVYLYWTESSTGADTADVASVPTLGNRVDRYIWNGSSLTFDRNLIRLRAVQEDAGQPQRGNHNGGIVRFGLDGKLYILIGDVGRRGFLQNLNCGPTATCPGPMVADDQFGGPEPDNNHLTGAILRLNDDGSTPADNPYAGIPTVQETEITANIRKLFAYGIRNSFGMAFDPWSGNLWTQENGDDAFDEINRVPAGFNGGWVQLIGPSSRIAEYKSIETTYGNGTMQQLRWPPTLIADTPAEALSRLYSLPGSQYVEPQFSWKYALAPSPIGFVNGNGLGAEYNGDLFVGASRTTLFGGYLFRFKLSGDRQSLAFSDSRLQDKVADNLDKFDVTESDSLLIGKNFGVTTDIQTGPDGNLYVVSLSNGAIYRITSEQPTVFVANLTGAQEVPPNSSTATGTATLLLDPNEDEARLALDFSGLSSAQTGAHIHGPGAAGSSAPILFHLANGSLSDVVISLTPTDVQNLKNGLLYINVHSSNFPNGEIRGQFGTSSSASSIQFNAATYRFSESAGVATVNVTRLGDISSAAAVSYATSDSAGGPNNCNVVSGNASAQCDYTTTIGKLNFAAGETLKTISIPITNDVYAEGDENFTLSLTSATGALLGSPNVATTTISDNETTNGTNPIDSSDFFVYQHYIDFLNRQPDPSGYAFWINNIESCGADAGCREVKRIHTSAAFFQSIEFHETGLVAYLTNRAAFGNMSAPNPPVPLTYNQFVNDAQILQKDFVFGAPGAEAQLEANKQAYFNEFVTRPAFVAKYGALSNRDFVDTLFATATVATTTGELTIAGLNGAQVVPPTASTATGVVTVRQPISGLTFSASLSFTGLSSAETVAHLHGPAATNANGPIIATLPNGQVVNFPITLTLAQAQQLASGQLYVDVHTTNFPEGEIRARLPNVQFVRDVILNALDAGLITRAQALRLVAESAFLKQNEFRRAFVLMEYFGYLRRDPDTAGYNFWLTKLNSFNGDFVKAEMVKAFITSTEYRQRFGP
ncbi:MAG TPA: CHRD domain-containing protein [Pyrinomonadaceae bacterium]|nr:CHRD domain-containing protein [Pyrinomonadaceae bacterium]